jgi:cobalt-zinc-cadmium resistance protein CzcA
MLARIVAASVSGRWIVLGFTVAFLALGAVLVANIPIDAFPDLTNNQVVVTAEAPRMPPSEIDQLVTFPLGSSLMGIPHMQVVRSMSKLGLVMVTIIFDDSVSTYFARQLVNERLQQARSRLPDGVQPVLGPLATAFGEVYQYTVDGPMPLMDRKTLHDWQIRYDLRALPGVSEVNSWGGETRQYTIQPDTAALQKYSLTTNDLYLRVKENNENFGGGFINYGTEQYTVLGLGRARNETDLANTVVLARAGVPVLLKDVARVGIAAFPRQGAVLRDGNGETVAGMVIQLKGENGLRVIERVKNEIGLLGLPDQGLGHAC